MGGCAHLPRKQTPLPHNCVREGIPTVLPQPVESSPPGSQGELMTGAGWMSSHPSPSRQQHSKEQTGPGALISKESPKLTRGVGTPPPSPPDIPLFPHFDSTAGGKGWGLSQTPHLPLPVCAAELSLCRAHLETPSN